ncbi:hypothetical protein D3C77_568260 [compost metagenome]
MQTVLLFAANDDSSLEPCIDDCLTCPRVMVCILEFDQLDHYCRRLDYVEPVRHGANVRQARNGPLNVPFYRGIQLRERDGLLRHC